MDEEYRALVEQRKKEREWRMVEFKKMLIKCEFPPLFSMTICSAIEMIFECIEAHHEITQMQRNRKGEL